MRGWRLDFRGLRSKSAAAYRAADYLSQRTTDCAAARDFIMVAIPFLIDSDKYYLDDKCHHPLQMPEEYEGDSVINEKVLKIDAYISYIAFISNIWYIKLMKYLVKEFIDMGRSAKMEGQFIPTKEDAVLAKQALGALSRLYKNKKLRLTKALSIENLAMPAGVVSLLLELLNQTAQGHAVVIVPSTKEFSTQEAADLLNVSRPFVIKLLEEGKIPHHKVGRHRRINAPDLFAYRGKILAESRRALGELAQIAQELELGYE